MQELFVFQTHKSDWSGSLVVLTTQLCVYVGVSLPLHFYVSWKWSQCIPNGMSKSERFSLTSETFSEYHIIFSLPYFTHQLLIFFSPRMWSWFYTYFFALWIKCFCSCAYLFVSVSILWEHGNKVRDQYSNRLHERTHTCMQAHTHIHILQSEILRTQRKYKVQWYCSLENQDKIMISLSTQHITKYKRHRISM